MKGYGEGKGKESTAGKANGKGQQNTARNA